MHGIFTCFLKTCACTNCLVFYATGVYWEEGDGKDGGKVERQVHRVMSICSIHVVLGMN